MKNSYLNFLLEKVPVFKSQKEEPVIRTSRCLKTRKELTCFPTRILDS